MYTDTPMNQRSVVPIYGFSYIEVTKATLNSRFYLETLTRQYVSINAFCLLPWSFLTIKTETYES